IMRYPSASFRCPAHSLLDISRSTSVSMVNLYPNWFVESSLTKLKIRTGDSSSIGSDGQVAPDHFPCEDDYSSSKKSSR
ncbi:MAG: hypothetical protein V2I33_23790, partial [Kangiellaceae bacterium]|nr:hypothetical protein [Kangiellaceae bacterium]